MTDDQRFALSLARSLVVARELRQRFDHDHTLHAAPGRDPDGDGHTNAFEYIAGTLPNNSLSAFSERIEPVSGQSNRMNAIFNPRLADRLYPVQFRRDLVGPPDWATLTGRTQSDNGQEHTVTDLNATEARKFYRVAITKP